MGTGDVIGCLGELQAGATVRSAHDTGNGFPRPVPPSGADLGFLKIGIEHQSYGRVGAFGMNETSTLP